MTEEEKQEIKEIVSLLTEGVLTDEKIKKASAKLNAFKLEWLFGKKLEVKEIHWMSDIERSVELLHEKIDKLSEKISDMPCKVNDNRIKNLEKIVYGAVKIVLVAFIFSIISFVFYQGTGKTEVSKNIVLSLQIGNCGR